MQVSCLHVFFTGRVQGVGFRWTCQKMARSLELRGWVQNLPDGRVEMLATGPEVDLERLINQLESRFQIEKKEIFGDQKFKGQDFQIRR